MPYFTQIQNNSIVYLTDADGKVITCDACPCEKYYIVVTYKDLQDYDKKPVGGASSAVVKKTAFPEEDQKSPGSCKGSSSNGELCAQSWNVITYVGPFLEKSEAEAQAVLYTKPLSEAKFDEYYQVCPPYWKVTTCVPLQAGNCPTTCSYTTEYIQADCMGGISTSNCPSVCNQRTVKGPYNRDPKDISINTTTYECSNWNLYSLRLCSKDGCQKCNDEKYLGAITCDLLETGCTDAEWMAEAEYIIQEASCVTYTEAYEMARRMGLL